MLKLIVLGQIPGTTVQLTFLQIMYILAGFYGCLLLVYEIRRFQK